MEGARPLIYIQIHDIAESKALAIDLDNASMMMFNRDRRRIGTEYMFAHAPVTDFKFLGSGDTYIRFKWRYPDSKEVVYMRAKFVGDTITYENIGGDEYGGISLF